MPIRAEQHARKTHSRLSLLCGGGSGWISILCIKNLTATFAGGGGRTWHVRQCAEDDPTGWVPCWACKGSGKTSELIPCDIPAEIEALKAENERLSAKDKTAKYHVYMKKWADVQVQNAKLQFERNALIMALRSHGDCDYCKYYDSGICRSELFCEKGHSWEWKGLEAKP